MTAEVTEPKESDEKVRTDIDLRDSLGSEVWFQGVRPLCVPIAVSQAHEVARYGDAMAPEAIWWACSKLNQVSADGMLLAHAGTALRLGGQPVLSNWPWNEALGVGTEEPPETAGKPPWFTAQLEVVGLAHDGVEDEIEDALEAGYPVVLTVELTDEFENVTPDGFIGVPDIRSQPGDYHAVLAVGAATDAVHGRRLLVRNSWGEHWGAGGYAWLPMDYLVANVLEAAIVRPEEEEE